MGEGGSSSLVSSGVWGFSTANQFECVFTGMGKSLVDWWFVFVCIWAGSDDEDAIFYNIALYILHMLIRIYTVIYRIFRTFTRLQLQLFNLQQRQRFRSVLF